MKKNYCKPTMNVVKIQHQQTLLAGSVDSVNSGTQARRGFLLRQASLRAERDSPAGHKEKI